ncbi:hypothetical protein L8S32_05260 [Enterobacter asburiae]|uniref:hypothetical protein n=1 Tax=Enterobacter asburiae TaxID=61645 RepID=UPI0020062E15|nr:hypothetical protein [Enterobacter asburiae]MCK6836267.1 hypothetical protein [Enterobacter asburiae]
MKEFKGTPGPWRFDEHEALSGGPVFYISQDDNAKYTPNYSDVSQTCSGELKHIQKANAQLIAEAPNLLKALIDSLPIWENMKLDVSEASVLLDCRAAISKALGEE